MQAAVIERFGDLTGLVVRDVPDPGAVDNAHVLVQVRAAAVNPSDAKNVQGAFSDTTLPRIPGRDFAGVVLAGPPNLIGQDVWGTGGEIGFKQDGSHAAFIKLPATGVWPKPVNLSFEQAAAVGTPFATAWTGLVDRGRMTGHDTVLVIGASGAVGSAAVQIARWKGARVFGTVRDAGDAKQAIELGCEEAIDLRQGDLGEQVKKATHGKGATLIMDTVGGILFEPALSALAVGGRLVEIAVTGERRVSFDLLDFYRRELRLYGVNTRHLTVSDGARILESLSPGFEAGVLHAPEIAEVFPLAKAREAFELAASGNAGGKVILAP